MDIVSSKIAHAYLRAGWNSDLRLGVMERAKFKAG